MTTSKSLPALSPQAQQGGVATRERRRVQVGPFLVDDLTSEEVVDRAVELALDPQDRVRTLYALHVGGLNARRDEQFVEEMNAADLVYADGGSVVVLGRMAGAGGLERSPTTDIGWDVLRRLTDRLGHAPRVAMVGGADGIAARAGEVLASHGCGEIVFATNGYVRDWSSTVQQLAASRPDVVVVGLGAPLEMLWSRRWSHALPPSLIMTCGGWFGFLVGHEKRAPRALRLPGLEWVARVAQSPRRLGGRYARGLWTTAMIAGRTTVDRLST